MKTVPPPRGSLPSRARASAWSARTPAIRSSGRTRSTTCAPWHARALPSKSSPASARPGRPARSPGSWAGRFPLPPPTSSGSSPASRAKNGLRLSRGPAVRGSTWSNRRLGNRSGAAKAFGDRTLLVAFGAPDEDLRWFERQPLFGKRVLVTRATEQASETAALLRDYGAEPLVVPTIALYPPRDSGPLDRALADLRRGAYGWVAFTSANGVERTWASLVASGADARAFGGVRLAAIGPATGRALARYGLRADVVAKEFRGEGLADELLRALAGGAAAARVLLPRAAKARDVLPEALRAAGCVVDVVAAYETRPPPARSGRRATDRARSPPRRRRDVHVEQYGRTSLRPLRRRCRAFAVHSPHRLHRPGDGRNGPLARAPGRRDRSGIHRSRPDPSAGGELDLSGPARCRRTDGPTADHAPGALSPKPVA